MELPALKHLTIKELLNLKKLVKNEIYERAVALRKIQFHPEKSSECEYCGDIFTINKWCPTKKGRLCSIKLSDSEKKLITKIYGKSELN